MTTFPSSPILRKGGIVLIDPNSSKVLRIIALQYNPDTLTRTLQVKGVGAESGDRSEALRLKGPPVETIKLDAEIDLVDQSSVAIFDAKTTQPGLHPQLAALETLIYPTSAKLESNNSLAQAGTLEIAPMEAPLTLFIFGESRILPVRLTEFSITEDAFDVALNPIRAKVSLGMRVLSVDDLGFDHKGGNLFMNYLKQKEQFARRNETGKLSTLGIKGIP
ncbi:MAG: hypothetical protein PVJ21_16010 [Anaerolineales bacterium]|jgi:hypothetical protein